MTEKRHSPTPWHREKGSFDYVIAANGVQMAITDSEETAETIVSRVNAHDDLVAALKGIVDDATVMTFENGVNGIRACVVDEDVIAAATAALKKAGAL